MEWIVSRLSSFGPGKLGVAAIVVAVFLLSLSDVLVKDAGERFGLGQIVFLRSLVAGVVIAGAVMAVSNEKRFSPMRPAWVWARSLCLTAMWFCYYAALPSMSLSLAAACYYSSPAWMALLARFVLKEEVNGLHWVAIMLTLSGVLLVTNPAVGNLPPATVLPLIAAFFYALAAIITRSRCRDEAPAIMALNLNITLVFTSGIFIIGLALFAQVGTESFVSAVWPTLRLEDWLLATLLGLLLAVIATAVAQSYRLAPTPVVGVFDNAYLLFAALWSAALFDEMPTIREAGGMTLIVAGAILVTWKKPSSDAMIADD
ncbi:DMT family transporter [Roseibium marinum]|uniref:Threonine/homoserine efflux transporter RhtA n=1 Tax=Roseibium marinum TaxID=281252 RepID=A0A2S3V3M2_9HYPH|nr:DMT family transporter [Roseibium marinum]POF34584.1 threonine/homoserine efflux transporter RhtA [Roseibium marinum]